MERSRLTLLAVALATFMTYLDNNIINVAIPAIQQDLGLTTSGLEWVVSSYILVFASLLLTGGRLADARGHGHRHGRRAAHRPRPRAADDGHVPRPLVPPLPG